jgi:DNA mismatch repair protein MutS2
MPSKTLNLLEWPRLCQHLSTFAATKLGVVAALALEVPLQLQQSQRLLDQTQEIYDLENLRLTPLVFNGIHDISAALERAEKQGVLSGDELLQLATTLAGTRQLRRLIDRHPDLVELNGLVADLRTYPELEQEIHHCIDDHGEVADRASEKLVGIRLKQRQVHGDIHKILQRILQHKAGALQEQIITQRGDRFVIPVKAPQKDAVPGIVHDTSTSGVTLYIEPQSTVNLNNQLRQLKRQADIESEAIRRQLTEQVAAAQADLEQLVVIVTTLDLATARARYSYWLKGNRPRFIEAHEPLTLRQLRHPLLVWQHHHEEGEAVVAIDVIISPQIKVVAITGPNTGGKTVTLKTLGLAFLMAKVGLFIPAQEPVELPWFDQVLADIGDEQSLQQNLSTFSGHIRRIQTILESLTDQSLVLLDEVGAGTDPQEGSALAIALLQHLADTAQLTVATTHFGELKALKYQDARFENASVEFNDQTLAPTYRLLWGIPGRSNALSIAKRLGFRESILDQAQRSLGGQTQEVNEVIAGLEDQRRQQERKAQDAARLLQSTEQLHRQVSEKATELKVRERELKQQQERAIQHEINVARKEIAKVIRQLQQGPQTAQAAQSATDHLGALAQQRLPSQRSQTQAKAPPFRPQIGDRVRIPSIGQKADVIAFSPDDDEITVRFGLMKMTVNVTEIESLTGEKIEPKPAPAPPPPQPITVRTSANTIDLRGARVADAERVLEDAIAQAHGLLWIIHGHGTGKLRAGVQAYLKQNARVKSFEFAEQSEGGTGVTIAHCQT